MSDRCIPGSQIAAGCHCLAVGGASVSGVLAGVGAGVVVVVVAEGEAEVEAEDAVQVIGNNSDKR